jgi:hypothetical protein
VPGHSPPAKLGKTPSIIMVMQLPGPNKSKKGMVFFAHFCSMTERKGRGKKDPMLPVQGKVPVHFFISAI